jgi:hypothetical protein
MRFWLIIFGIVLLTGCETQPKKVKQYGTVPAPVERVDYERYWDRICTKGCHKKITGNYFEGLNK